MKYRFLFFFLIISNLIYGQFKVKGIVYINNKPIDGAAVYLNNTMIGTTTNIDGIFALSLKEGKYELIVSYLGYKKIKFNLDTDNIKNNFRFNLEEEENVLDEVVIKKTVFDDEWNYHFIVFRKEFIGISNAAKECKITNPKVLRFEYNRKTNTLKAFAKKPLIIEHKSLGYLITYELVNFNKTGNYVSVSGYSRFKDLKDNKRKQKRWKKNRLKAYRGSPMHFFKSVISNSIKKEGFIVNQFKRVPNKERPSEKEILKARQLIRLSMPNINFSKKIDQPRTALDSALLITRKTKLPKFKDYLYKSKLKSDDILIEINGKYYLTFNDNLSIIFTKEREERNYVFNNLSRRNERKLMPQTSSILPFKKSLEVEKTGVLVEPLNILYEGYWSYEKFANMLPLDYEPE